MLRVKRGEGWFGDLQLSCLLQSEEEESQCGWCVVSSFASLTLRVGVLVCGFFDLAPLSRNLSFIAFLSSGWIKLGFLCFLLQRPCIGQKITFNYFLFFDKFHRHMLCADPMCRSPFFHSEESLNTDNIRWMLLWMLVGIIILCVR